MKKILLILSIFLIFIFTPKLNGIIENDKYKESVYQLNFTNLNSKKLNEILLDTESIIIEVTVNIKGNEKTYRFFSSEIITNDKKIIEKVLNDITNKELLTDIKLNGIKITNIKLRTTEYFYNIIKERSKKYE